MPLAPCTDGRVPCSGASQLAPRHCNLLRVFVLLALQKKGASLVLCQGCPIFTSLGKLFFF